MSEVAHRKKALSLRVWVLAGLGAVMLHAGCVALALEHMRPDDQEDVTGAVAIEIGVEFTSLRVDPTDLPAGPDADASTASPAVMEQQAVVEQTDLPKAVPTDTEDPDRLVTPNDVKNPKDEDPKIMTVQATPSVQSIDSEAAAPPNTEKTPEGVRSVAPAIGIGESARRERTTWQKELAAHLDKHKRYPADRSRQTAEIMVGFVLDRTGHVLSATIARSSGDASFDNAALAMMKRADPVPPPPARVADDGLSFTLPVIFRVKGRN